MAVVIECESEGFVADGDANVDASGWLLPFEGGVEHEVADDEFGGADEGVIAVSIGHGCEV